MLCSWYDDVGIALSMIDTKYLRLSLICYHGNCSRLNTSNLCGNICLFNSCPTCYCGYFSSWGLPIELRKLCQSIKSSLRWSHGKLYFKIGSYLHKSSIPEKELELKEEKIFYAQRRPRALYSISHYYIT